MTWDKLSAEDQKLIRDAIQVGMDYQRQVWSEAEEKSEKLLKEAGVTIYEPTEEELGKPYEEFVQKVRSVE